MSTNKKQQGQSTIEFIFTFAFGVGVIFLIFNSALNYTKGYLVHYATFMASRVYLTNENYMGTIASPDFSIRDSAEAARATYNKYMLSIFDIPNESFKVNGPDGSPAGYLTTGATTIFDLKIDVIGRITGQSLLELASESFLGKEPTRAQCANRICYSLTGGAGCSDGGGGDLLDITLYDNGC